MTRFALALLALAAAGCSSGGARPPHEDNPLLAGMPAPYLQRMPTAEAGAQALLQEYARRFTEGYPLFTGDKLQFIVAAHPQLSFEALVPAEGAIDFPNIGRINLAGRSTAEIRGELARRLADGYVVNPDVSVLVSAYARRAVSIMGAVVRPGEHELPSGRPVTLLQALGQAGGMREDAEKRVVLILRPKSLGSPDRVTFMVDTVAISRTADAKDPLVLPDDVVMVPTRDRVYVFGQVVKGGGFIIPADQPTSITKAIAMAGGFTRIAKESSVRLNRRKPDGSLVTYVIDVSRILAGHPEEDVDLQPGDVIYVPESFF